MPVSRLQRLILVSTFCLTLLLIAVPSVSASSFIHTRQGAQPLSCPKISSFTPTSGAPGTTVTISGCGFTGTTSVTFQGVSASFTVNSDTQITATVPSGATSGKITVTTPTKTVKSSAKFLVSEAIALSPTAGPPTSSLTVSGTGFGSGEAVDIYFDTTDEALASANGQGAFGGISIQVPASAVPGTHWVTAIGRHSGLSAQAPFLVQTDWAEFRDVATHTGVNRYENVLSSANVANLDSAWSAVTGERIYSSPAVVDGVVYAGSFDGNLYAFNAQTGTQLWAAPTGSNINCSPAVANGIVYIGSYDGKLYAFNAQTGTQLWAAPAGNAIASPPTVVGGVVYVGSEDDNLYAFNAQTGSLLWSAPTDDEIFSSPAVTGGVAYVGTFGGKLYAFNSQTGAQLWSVTTGSRIVSSPTVVDGIVYIGSLDGKLYAFNTQTGGLLWAVPAGYEILSSPAVVAGIVYIGGYDGTLYAFSAHTGVLYWSAATDGSIIESSPTVANGLIYIGTDNGDLYAFSSSGVQLWSTVTGGALVSAPAVTNGMVYVGSLDHRLYAYALPPNDQLKPPTRPSPTSLHPNLNLRSRK